MKEMERMKKLNEHSIDELFSEDIEARLFLLENPDFLDEFTLFSASELDWWKEVFGSDEPIGKRRTKYKAQRMSKKKKEELKRAENRYKNYKSRVKKKAVKETQDLVRFAWINQDYSDDALLEILPLSAIAFLVQTVVLRFGYEYAMAIASAIENGMRIYQRRVFRELPDLYEVSVPVMTRFKSETAGELSLELWKRASERLAGKQSEKEE
jgi:hypothetical protein